MASNAPFANVEFIRRGEEQTWLQRQTRADLIRLALDRGQSHIITRLLYRLNEFDRLPILDALIPHTATLVLFNHTVQLLLTIMDVSDLDQLRLVGDALVASWGLLRGVIESEKGIRIIKHLLISKKREVDDSRSRDLASSIVNAVPFEYWTDNISSLSVLRECIPFISQTLLSQLLNSPNLSCVLDEPPPLPCQLLVTLPPPINRKMMAEVITIDEEMNTSDDSPVRQAEKRLTKRKENKSSRATKRLRMDRSHDKMEVIEIHPSPPSIDNRPASLIDTVDQAKDAVASTKPIPLNVYRTLTSGWTEKGEDTVANVLGAIVSATVLAEQVIANPSEMDEEQGERRSERKEMGVWRGIRRWFEEERESSLTGRRVEGTTHVNRKLLRLPVKPTRPMDRVKFSEIYKWKKPKPPPSATGTGMGTVVVPKKSAARITVPAKKKQVSAVTNVPDEEVDATTVVEEATVPEAAESNTVLGEDTMSEERTGLREITVVLPESTASPDVKKENTVSLEDRSIDASSIPSLPSVSPPVPREEVTTIDVHEQSEVEDSSPTVFEAEKQSMERKEEEPSSSSQRLPLREEGTEVEEIGPAQLKPQSIDNPLPAMVDMVDVSKKAEECTESKLLSTYRTLYSDCKEEDEDTIAQVLEAIVRATVLSEEDKEAVKVGEEEVIDRKGRRLITWSPKKSDGSTVAKKRTVPGSTRPLAAWTFAAERMLNEIHRNVRKSFPKKETPPPFQTMFKWKDTIDAHTVAKKTGGEDTVAGQQEDHETRVLLQQDTVSKDRVGSRESTVALPEPSPIREVKMETTVSIEDQSRDPPFSFSVPSTVVPSIPPSPGNSTVSKEIKREPSEEVTVARASVDRGADVTAMAMTESGASKIVSGLARKSPNGRSIIFSCIQDTVLPLAMDAHGHRVVQWFLSHGSLDQRLHLIDRLIPNLETLVQCGGYGRSTADCVITSSSEEKKGALKREYERALSSPSVLGDDEDLPEKKRKKSVVDESDDEIRVIRCIPAPIRTVSSTRRTSRALFSPVARPVHPSEMLDQNEFMQRLESIIEGECKPKDLFYLTGALSKGKVPDPEENPCGFVKRRQFALIKICSSSSSLCSQSEISLKIVLAVAQKWPACCVDIGIKIVSILDTVTRREPGRMLVRLLLNQKTGMSFAVSCFNDGLSSPFFSLLNGDDAVRELVDDIFDAASRQVKLAFVQEHKEGIMQTRHGHSFFRGLYKSGLITEPAADLVTEESAKSEGGPTTERIEK